MEPRQQVSRSLYFQLYSALSTNSPGAKLIDSPSEPWLVVPKFGKHQNHKGFVKKEGVGPACRVSDPAGLGWAWEPAFLTSSWCCCSRDQQAENHWCGLSHSPAFLCPFPVTFFEKKLGLTCVFCLDSPVSRDRCLPYKDCPLFLDIEKNTCNCGHMEGLLGSLSFYHWLKRFVMWVPVKPHCYSLTDFENCSKHG